jgi:hypothetical protein
VFRQLRCCLTLLILLVIGAGVLAYFAFAQTTRPFLRPATPSAAAPPPATAPPPVGAQGVDARIAQAEAGIRQAAATGQHVPVQFIVTDAELTSRVNEGLARGEVQVPVSDVVVRSVPNQVNISGQVKAAVVTVPFTMTAVPRVTGGKAQLQVTGVDFGGVAVPGPLASQLTNIVSSDNLLGDLPLTVTSFRAEQGRLVLEGTT